jgi:Zn-dependent protease
MHWSVLVIALLLAQALAAAILPDGAPGHSTAAYWSAAVAVSAIFLVGLLAHEFAHALVARHYGIRVRRITLWLLGGVAELDGQAPHARADLLVALAGPAASAAVAGAAGAAALAADAVGGSDLAVVSLGWLCVVNAVLAAFNLLPGAPLDGGRVLRAALWWARGDRVAAGRTASRAGFALGLLLVCAGLAELWLNDLSGVWLALLGWFLAAAARAEESADTLRSSLAGLTVADVMTSPAVCGYSSQTIDGFLGTIARRHPYTTYPVLDLDGRVTGIISLSRMARVPQVRRGDTRLADVQVPVSRIVVVGPGQSVADVAPEVLAAGHRLIPVAHDGHIEGVLTGTDVDRSVELAVLRALPSSAHVSTGG